MQAAGHHPNLMRRLAHACLLLLIAVTCLSAYLRHGAAGLGCTPWPACFGQGERAASPGAVMVAGQALTVARAAHRVTATVALLLVIAMVVVSLTARPRMMREAALSVALLAIAAMLALLGVFTPGARLPVVAVGNLIGGFLMLALAARLALAPAGDGLGVWALAVAALLLGQIASGAAVSASQAGLACTELRECTDQARAAGWDWQALNPWHEAAFAVGTPHADGALAQLVHRLVSIVGALAVAGLGVATLRRGRRRAGAALLGLLASEWGLGMVIGGSGLPLLPVLLHNLGAALLLAAVVRLA